MKFALFLSTAALFALGALAQGPSPQFRQNMQDCLKQFNADEAAVRSGTVDKCFYKCFEQKNGVMDANGNLSIDNFKAANPNAPAGLLTTLQNCIATSKKGDPCDTGKAMHDCMKASQPQGGPRP